MSGSIESDCCVFGMENLAGISEHRVTYLEQRDPLIQFSICLTGFKRNRAVYGPLWISLL